jgi:hypothetical protein
MSISYTWTVENMASQVQLDGYTDVVVEVAWSCIGTDGTYSATIPGLTRVTFTGSSEFTPYSDLTEEQVLNWVWSSGVDEASVQAQIDTQIELQINPPIVMLPLPWTN